MSSPTYIFADNFILNGVRGSLVKAIKVANYHYNALVGAAASDPFYIPLREEFKPTRVALLAITGEKGTDTAQRIGDTLDLDTLLKQLGARKIESWEPTIRAKYNSKSVIYKTIFPQGRKPFQQGKKDIKIEAVNQLQLILLNYPEFATTQAEVLAFYEDLTKARSFQEGKKQEIGSDRGTEDAAIEAMCLIHFKNHGLIISHTPDNPQNIASFIDVQTLQRPATANHTTGIVGSDTLKKIWSRKWKNGATLKLTNNGDVALRFFLSDKSGKDYPNAGITVQPNQNIQVPVMSLGPDSFKFLLVVNLDLDQSGLYEVELL